MKKNTNVDMKRFGYNWLTDLSAYQNYSKNINIYVTYYYSDIDTKKLIESPLFILNKNHLNDNYLTRKQQFNNALNEIKMQNIFPHTILEYFYYTDNRTVIPKEFLKEQITKESSLLQLEFF